MELFWWPERKIRREVDVMQRYKPPSSRMSPNMSDWKFLSGNEREVCNGRAGRRGRRKRHRVTGSEEWADRPMSDSRLLASNFPRAQSPREPEQARFRAASLHNERRKSPLNLGLYTSCPTPNPPARPYICSSRATFVARSSHESSHTSDTRSHSSLNRRIAQI